MSNCIVYILPSLGISGGVAVVLQHVARLRRNGYDASVIYLEGRDDISWFPEKNIPVYTLPDIQRIDIAIATHYTTIPCLLGLQAKRKIYFVQSDERRFSLNSLEDFQACNNSYCLNIEFMTEALWIQRWLQEEFGKTAWYIPNGIDKSIFFGTLPLQPKTHRPRLLLEGSIGFPFKGMGDAYNAIKNIDCELWIVSYYGKPKTDWIYDKFFERVAHDEMNAIYSSCDILLKLSRVEGFFGPPLEAMACGCTVVAGKVTGYDEYIRHEYNALVVESGDIEAAETAVRRLIDDRALCRKLIDNGFATADEWSWDNTLIHLEKMIGNETPEMYYTGTFPEPYDYRNTIRSVITAIELKPGEHPNERDTPVITTKTGPPLAKKVCKKAIRSITKRVKKTKQLFCKLFPNNK